MTPEKPAKLIVEESMGEKLSAWYDRNGNWINAAIVVVLAIVIGFKAYDWMHKRAVAKANMAYGEALNRFQTAVQQPDTAKKKDELNGAITAAQQVVVDHGDRYVGREAQLMIGNAQFAMASDEPGQNTKLLESARDSFKKYLDMAETNEEKATGHLARGNVQENLSFIQSDPKLLTEAIADYKDALAATEGSYLGAEAKLALARAISGQTGKESEAEAKKLLQEVAAKRPVTLVSKSAVEEKPIKLDSGATLTSEEINDMLNFTNWSQQKMAEDALVNFK